MANKHLAVARKQLDAGNTSLFYEAIYKGLYGSVADKLTITAASLNQEYIAEQIHARGVADELITPVEETLELGELAPFAPLSVLSASAVLADAKDGTAS